MAAVPLMLIPNLARFFVLIKVDPKCYDMAKMAKSLFIFLFFFHIWTYYIRKYRKVSHDMPHVIYHMKKIESHDECGN